MSGQQKFQIVSAGKTLRAKAPAEVLQEVASTFSVSAEQARKLFLKGWVIKDQLSPGQVVQYRTQLQQIGLKIEVHPAGKFDNRAILARLQFAQKRKARKESGAQPGRSGDTKPAAQQATQPKSAQKSAKDSVEKVEPTNSIASQAEVRAAKSATPKKSHNDTPAPRERESSAARAQLEALFTGESAGFDSLAQRLAMLPGLVSAALVPALFTGLMLFCIYSIGMALWALPASVMDGSFGVGTVISVLIKLLLTVFVGALLAYPFFTSRWRVLAESEQAVGLSIRKSEAPGLFLLLEVLETRSGLGIAGQQPGPKNLAVARGAKSTPIEVTAGSDVVVTRQPGEPRTLQLGLGAVATLNGGDVVALVARALSYHQGPLMRAGVHLSMTTAQRLKSWQDALEREVTLLSVEDEPTAARISALNPLHKLLSVCGLALVPVLERLQGVHRATSGAVARRLEARADRAAAQMIGSDDFAQFAERWNQLVHADLVCGEINREAQITGKRLADIPRAVRWLYRNLEEATRTSIDMAMAEDTDSWQPTEPAGHERIAAVEARQLSALLQRVDFSVQKLFTDFDELCARASRLGAEESCRAVENSLLLTASKETEEAQQVLSEYFNRVIPRDFLPLQGPQNAELADLGLQDTIDWLRSRLVDLQEQEQRLGQLQLSGARIQLGAALVRANVRVDSRRFELSGTTPSAAEASAKDNRARVQECIQQRQQLHQMFFQRIQGIVSGLSGGERGDADQSLAQLQGFERMREPLSSLDRYGDLVCELIEYLPGNEVPASLLQKYAQLAVQQIREVHRIAVEEPALLPAPLLEKLAACGAGDPNGVADARGGDLAGELQAIELRCKNASAVVCEGYHLALSSLLKLCLVEEGRRKVKPLRLAGTL
ncbi:hypothetical protein [Microbulbifer mangrovi]|uniref:hypothetical protein n=1 Tax=Microbulbifer mangrovi TaxID=927787 RepID=UPI0009906A51|nr:hypothetical protein [Microbulbifer mangrovi]